MYRCVWILLAVSCPLALAGQMETLHSWTTVDFTFASEEERSNHVATGKFVPENNLIIDVDVYDQKIFVTTPRLKTGTPSTLSLVTDQKRDGVTLLQPYPDWTWQSTDSCENIISVFRTKIDVCGRLWVIDTGVIDAFSTSNRICPPKILVFDMKTDKLIRKHVFPLLFVGDATLPVTIVVDTRNNDCEASFAYVADVSEFKLWVYDYANDKSWRINNNFFYPNPFYGDFHINGEHFELMDGIFGMALGPVIDGDRKLYFHSLAGVHEFHVSCSVIRNSELFSSDMTAVPRSFQAFKHTRSSQAAAQDISDNNVVFFGMVEENSIGCWNANFGFEKDYIDTVAKNEETLQFQSGLKVIDGKVYTLSNNFQKYTNNRMPVDKVTQRINVGLVSALVRDTKCQSGNAVARVARQFSRATRRIQSKFSSQSST